MSLPPSAVHFNCMQLTKTQQIRRELMCFPQVDADFLHTYTLSIMSQLDLKSDGAVRLLSEFLGDATEHFIQ